MIYKYKQAGIWLSSFLFLAGSYSCLMAQEVPMEVATSMQQLSFLIGSWEGEGWQMERTGQKMEFNQTEKITWKLGKSAILIEGKGTSKTEASGSPGVRQALGVISYHKNKNTYNFDAFLADGKSSHSEAKLTENGDFIWEIQLPYGGTIRYTIKFPETGKWVETGEISRGENNWSKFMEMTLSKKQGG
jgi:hypothetical protein